MKEKKVNKWMAISGLLLFVISYLFTRAALKYMVGYLGWEFLDKWYIVNVGAALLNICEAIAFIYWKINKNNADQMVTAWYSFALGCALGLVSISGSVAFFQSQYEMNILQSAPVAAQEDIAKQWMEDSKNRPDYAAWAKVKAERAIAKRDSLIQAGHGGVGNALYNVYAKAFKLDTWTVAFRLTVALAIIIELTAIFFTVASFGYTAPAPGPLPAPPSRSKTSSGGGIFSRLTGKLKGSKVQGQGQGQGQGQAKVKPATLQVQVKEQPRPGNAGTGTARNKVQGIGFHASREEKKRKGNNSASLNREKALQLARNPLFQKSDGSPNVTAIAKEIGVSRTRIQQYFKGE